MANGAESAIPTIPDLDPSRFVEIDLFGQEIKADPSAMFLEWGRNPPFYVIVNGRPNAVICRHEEVNKAFTDYETFSVAPHPGWGGDPFDYFNGLPTVGDVDPPRHTRLRRLMQPAFTPRRVAELQEGMTQLVDGLLDEVGAKGSFDMMTEFAQPLSRRLLLGTFFQFPESDWHILINFAEAGRLVSTVPPGAPKPKAYMDAFNAGKKFCDDYIELRRREPKDDLLGSIIAAHDEGGMITGDELFGTLITLFAAGFGTIAGSLGLSILRLCRHPDQLKLLQDDPALIAATIEECLRIDSLGNFRHRFIDKDTEMGGVPLYRGMMAQVSMGASNYDPTVFPDPDRFDIRRNPRDISTFGYGTHFCVGHMLARAALRTGIGRMVQRFPKIRLADRDARIRYGGLPTERMPVNIPLRVD